MLIESLIFECQLQNKIEATSILKLTESNQLWKVYEVKAFSVIKIKKLVEKEEITKTNVKFKSFKSVIRP